MTARQAFDSTIQRITGTDTRLMGNWEPLPPFDGQLAAICAALGISEGGLLRCADIADALELIGSPKRQIPEIAGQWSML